jgi:hypothetical protein
LLAQSANLFCSAAPGNALKATPSLRLVSEVS